jgi:hypothetical protein
MLHTPVLNCKETKPPGETFSETGRSIYIKGKKSFFRQKVASFNRKLRLFADLFCAIY